MKSILSFLLLFTAIIHAQVHHSDVANEQHELSPLFKDDSILKVSFTYSKKDILAKTNDSTYIETDLSYRSQNGATTSLKINFRARGNYRRLHCYYLPLWMKIDKEKSRGTIFEEDKKLKVVLPCLKSTRSNDHVIKEFLAYKIYELISPYHFETKMIAIQLSEDRGKKSLDHDLIGFFIQDDKKLAAASGGKIVKRRIHPNAQDPVSSTRNDMFQYMIGNTDYSLAYQHNEKLFYFDKKFIPVPYDFDMSGLVNASYAVVSEIKNKTLPISNVTTRLYRGFQQKESVIQQVRQEYIKKEADIFRTVDTYESFFKDPKEFKEARDFLEGFFKIIKDDKKFQTRIIQKARTKLD